MPLPTEVVMEPLLLPHVVAVADVATVKAGSGICDRYRVGAGKKIVV